MQSSDRSFEVIAQLLSEEKEDLLFEWAQRVREHAELPQAEQLPEQTLIDHLPNVLDLVIVELRCLADNRVARSVKEPILNIGKLHGRLRSEEGYTSGQLVGEMSILRELIFKRVEQRIKLLKPAIVIELNRIIDRVLVGAVAEFSRFKLLMFEAIVEQSPAGIVVCDQGGRIIADNQLARAIFGRGSLDASLEERPREFDVRALDGHLLSPDEVPLHRALQGQALRDEFFLIKTGNGVERTIEVNAAPLISNGRIVGAMSILLDKTEEQAFLRKREELQQMQERFIDILSHELKAPLTAIHMSAEMMLAGPGGAEERYRAAAGRAFSRIFRASRRMTSMIDELLDFSRAREKGKMSLHRGPFQLAALVESILEELGVVFPDSDFSLSIGGDTAGCWDRQRIGQVVSNLVTNAAKYGEKNRPIRIRAQGEPEGVELIVWNAGSIPLALQSQIFEPYVRAGSDAGGGLGLGLYITKAIVEAHGGNLRMTSSETQGTRFAVHLPRGEG